MIEQSIVAKIIDTAEIVEVLSDFITLKRKGVNYSGLCPFHNEKTPSFSVSPSKGIYKCFGCGKGGNAVNFIMEHEHLGFVDALKYLAHKYHIEIEEKELTQENIDKKNKRESLFIINEYAKDTFMENLGKTSEGISIGIGYLHERDFRDDIIEKFQVGYCSNKNDDFTQQALQKGYKKDFLIETGLTIKGTNKLFDRFKGRIMFPIHSLSGRVSGFGGRILRTDKKTAKYLNSPESEIYSKSQLLYGIYFAKTSMVKNDRCYLVEGYTDVIALHQIGIENVVASSGTSLTEDQIRLIQRFTKNITVLYDGDEAGIKASLRGIDLILAQGVNVRVLLLPEGEDPDSFSKRTNTAVFNEYIEKNETDFIKFKTQLLMKEAKDDPIKKAKLIIDIIRSIALIPDPIIRSVYIKECSNLLKVEEVILYGEIGKIRNINANNQLKIQRQSQSIENRQQGINPSKKIKEFKNAFDSEEKRLVYLLLHFGANKIIIDDIEGEEQKQTVAEFIIQEIFGDGLKSINPIYQFIFDEVKQNLEKKNFNIEQYFHTHINEKITAVVADILSQKNNLSVKFWTKDGQVLTQEQDKLKELVPKAINQYKFKKIKTLIKEIEQKIKRAQEENQESEIYEHIHTQMNLKKLERELIKNMGQIVIVK